MGAAPMQIQELTYLHRQNDHLLSAQVKVALHGQCGLVM